MVKQPAERRPRRRPAGYDALHAVKKGMKDALAPQGLFEDLGLKYVGPIDGHDRDAMEQALTQAKRFGGPVIVHAITRKGFGYDAGRAARGRPVPRARSVRRPDRRGEAQGPDLDRSTSPTRSSRSASAARTSSRSPPR